MPIIGADQPILGGQHLPADSVAPEPVGGAIFLFIHSSKRVADRFKVPWVDMSAPVFMLIPIQAG
jgi:hypothetical protein